MRILPHNVHLLYNQTFFAYKQPILFFFLQNTVAFTPELYDRDHDPPRASHVLVSPELAEPRLIVLKVSVVPREG